MRKYWIRFLSALQIEFQYRANLVAWMVVGAINPLVMTLVWFSVLKERPDVGGYGQSDFVLYYLMTTVGWYIVGGEFARALGSDIRMGKVNKSLLQPYNLVIGKAVWEQAWKVLSLILCLPVVALVLYVTRDFVQFSLDIAMIPYIIMSLVGGALIFALIQAIIGTAAFWVTEVWPMAEMNDMLLQLMGGMLAPIALLPPVFQSISSFLPFRYIFYEPIAIVLGKTTEPLPVLARQFGYVAILFIMYKLLWRAGIKKYEGIGG